MARLPFVVEPRRKPIVERIGSEDSGIIEIERRGYLTTGEKTFVQQVQQGDSGSAELITLSRRVARRYALGMDRAYGLVLGVISGGAAVPGAKELTEEDNALAAEIEVEFADELSTTVRSMATGQFRDEMVFAACMIRYRIDPDFDIGDIASLHPDLIEGLAGLYRDEDAKSLEAFQASEGEAPQKAVSVEEAEKKQGKASGSRSRSTTGD
jgi:hypothetical protein